MTNDSAARGRYSPAPDLSPGDKAQDGFVDFGSSQVDFFIASGVGIGVFSWVSLGSVVPLDAGLGEGFGKL